MNRSSQQNKALHKYLSDLANELEAHGITQKMFIDELKGWDIPITKEFLKMIWKLKQKKMFLTDSTTKLKTDQVSQVYDAVNMFTSTVFGVSTPFPSEEDLPTPDA
jgi:ABC-type phosphate/phosphonate transport system ATPase subunit